MKKHMPEEDAANIPLFFGYIGLFVSLALCPAVAIFVGSGGFDMSSIPKQVYGLILLEGEGAGVEGVLEVAATVCCCAAASAGGGAAWPHHHRGPVAASPAHPLPTPLPNSSPRAAHRQISLHSPPPPRPQACSTTCLPTTSGRAPCC
jgi:hypothetical protein